MAEQKDMKKWMEKLSDKATKLPITQLAIPGSHDSGTVNLKTDLGVIDESPRAIKLLVKLPYFGKRIIRDWAKTQDLSITGQLEAGIRYLDLRVACRLGTDDLHIVHTLYGDLVSKELEYVNSFLKDNPKEVVILDFNHFYDMSEETHNKLLDSLSQIFGEKCTPPPTENMWSLDALWNTQHRVISLYKEEAGYQIPQKHKVETVWPYEYTTNPPKNRIESPWANTDNLETLKNFLKDRHNYYVEDFNQFYVWQGVLTPTSNGKTSITHIWSTLKNVLSLPATKAFVDWLKSQKNITICIVDYVENDNFIKDVVDKNNLDETS